MNRIEHCFHRESAVHILLEEAAYCALRSTGSGENHQKPCTKHPFSSAFSEFAAIIFLYQKIIQPMRSNNVYIQST